MIKKIKGCFIGSALAGAMGTGLITDDTQMAMFTAEGLILSRVRPDYRDKNQTPEAVYHSLLRWLYTQQTSLLGDLLKTYGSCSIVDGILMGHQQLFDLRDPSGTCLESLGKNKMGTLAYRPNNSRGPGAIVRNIPIGLAFKDSSLVFQTACQCAVITHGHPEAYLSAGFLSCLINEIINSNPLEEALEKAIDILKTHKDHEDVLETVYQAKNLSMRLRPQSLSMNDFFPERSALHVLGTGLFLALAFGSEFKKGFEQTMEQSNSSEASALTGGILGALHGLDAVPAYLISSLELCDVILELAEDLVQHFYS